MTVADVPNLSITGSSSVSFLLNTTSTALSIILGFYLNSGAFQGFGVGINIVTAGLLATWSDIDGGWKENSIAVNTGNWVHCVITRVAGTVSFYINGQFDVSAASSLPSAYSGNRAIAAEQDGTVPLNGQLAFLTIHNRVLTPREVLQSYFDPFVPFRCRRPRRAMATVASPSVVTPYDPWPLWGPLLAH
jgi:hypothetical protein